MRLVNPAALHTIYARRVVNPREARFLSSCLDAEGFRGKS
jgi:hypothetical protein